MPPQNDSSRYAVTKQRYEIGVAISQPSQPTVALKLVVWAGHEGDAVLLAHGQIAALLGNKRKGTTVSFSS